MEFNLQELSEDLDVSPDGSRKSKPAAACAVFTIHQSTRASSRFYRLNSMTRMSGGSSPARIGREWRISGRSSLMLTPETTREEAGCGATIKRYQRLRRRW
jgi:hypothetical protein